MSFDLRRLTIRIWAPLPRMAAGCGCIWYVYGQAVLSNYVRVLSFRQIQTRKAPKARSQEGIVVDVGNIQYNRLCMLYNRKNASGQDSFGTLITIDPDGFFVPATISLSSSEGIRRITFCTSWNASSPVRLDKIIRRLCAAIWNCCLSRKYSSRLQRGIYLNRMNGL